MKLIQYVHRTVTYGDWGVSCTGSYTGTITLNVYRSRIAGKDLPVSKWMRGFGDGRIFPSYDAAFQFAFEHGYTMLYFTEPELRAKRKREAVNRSPVIASKFLF